MPLVDNLVLMIMSYLKQKKTWMNRALIPYQPQRQWFGHVIFRFLHVYPSSIQYAAYKHLGATQQFWVVTFLIYRQRLYHHSYRQYFEINLSLTSYITKTQGPSQSSWKSILTFPSALAVLDTRPCSPANPFVLISKYILTSSEWPKPLSKKCPRRSQPAVVEHPSTRMTTQLWVHKFKWQKTVASRIYIPCWEITSDYSW